MKIPIAQTINSYFSSWSNCYTVRVLGASRFIKPPIHFRVFQEHPHLSIQILSRSLNETESNFAVINYVYLKSNGTIYESNIDTSAVGKNIGNTEPTTTSASHFAWEVLDKVNHKLYFLDHLAAEIISTNNSKIF